MSQPDIELVREVSQRWLATGELTEISPSVELRDHDLPDAAGVVYRGEEGFSRWLSDWAEAWSDWTVEPQEYVDVGRGRVVLVLKVTASGRESGAEVERRDGIVYTLRRGTIVAMDYYGDADQALAAART
jgi:ketosteroid isomerase-like protein